MEFKVSNIDETVNAFSNKMECWSYEEKVRAIIQAEGKSNRIKIPKECIKEIYYGWYYEKNKYNIEDVVTENIPEIAQYKMLIDLMTRKMEYKRV